MNYAESDAEDDEDVFQPVSANAAGRASKRRKVASLDDSDDDFGPDPTAESAAEDDGMFTLIN